jgi:uncharacterized protein (TIGR02265 family)
VSEFRAARRDLSLDLDAIIASLPTDASIKGMFALSTLERAKDRKRAQEESGLGAMRIQPFSDVPYGPYLRLVFAIAEQLHPRLPRAEGLRLFHHSYYETLSKSMVGRVMFGVLGKETNRVLGMGPRGYEVSVRFARVISESQGSGHIRYNFENYPAAIIEACDAGVMEGALAFCGETQGVVRVRIDGPLSGALDARW